MHYLDNKEFINVIYLYLSTTLNTYERQTYINPLNTELNPICQ